MPTYDYDLKAAFPTVSRGLVDLRQCEWVNNKEYAKGAVYGYVKGLVTIKDNVFVHPITHTDEQGDVYTPTGTWQTVLTKCEIDFINKWGIGSFEIEDGWWAVPTADNLKHPFAGAVDSLLRYKGRGGLMASLAKRMATGIYGKMGEERENDIAPYFNPVYFAEISTQARLKVAEWLYNHKIGPGDNEGYQSLLHISVDGVLLDKKVSINKDKEWKLEQVSPALIISSGLTYLLGKKPAGLYLGDVLRMIKEHPGESIYRTTLIRRATLGESVDNLDNLGKQKEFWTGFNLLTIRHDRDFEGSPKTGRQLLNKQYKSRPRMIQ